MKQTITGLGVILLLSIGFVVGFLVAFYGASGVELPPSEGGFFSAAPTGFVIEPAALENLNSSWGEVALFILAGQSNMSGRGLDFFPGEVDRRVFVFGNDYRWRQAREPIDDPTGQVDLVSEDLEVGYSPAVAFALSSLERDPRMVIGLVPCAKGASSIIEWQKDLSDQSLYGSCLKRARAVSTAGQLRGILFFQGEADAIDPDLFPEHPPGAENWAALFTRFAEDFRKDLSNPDLPIIFAQIGTNAAPGSFVNWDLIKQQQQSVHLPWVAMIETEDLPLQDEVHFTSASYRVIGRRYSDAYWALLEQGP